MIFNTISWWSIWIVVGIISCLFAFDKLCAVRKVTSGANKFYYFIGILAIVIGFLSASLVQSYYNVNADAKAAGMNFFQYVAQEGKQWQWGGVTFMGGMYGGVVSFVVIGLIFARGNNRAQFGQICEIGLTCIPIAHAFGRVGCFAVGCCYGARVMEGDAFSFLGVIFKHGEGAGVLRYPTQLFEAIFLFILAAVMILMVIKDKKINSVLYFAAYGVFRFMLEFLRDDARGQIGSALTLSPSQVLSIVSVCVALVMLALILIKKYKPEWAEKISHFFRLDVELSTASATVEAHEKEDNQPQEAVQAPASEDEEKAE